MLARFVLIICLFPFFLPSFVMGEIYNYAEKDPLNHYYMVSEAHSRIVRLTTREGSIVRGDGSAMLSQLQAPAGLQIQFPSSVWVLDRLNRTILEFDMKLNFLTVVTLPEKIEEPGAFLILEDGSWLIADWQNEKIWQLRPGFSLPIPWGMGSDLTYIPSGLRMIRNEKRIYLFSAEASIAWIADTQGRVLRRIDLPDSLKSRYPAGGREDVFFVSGPAGTWMLAPGRDPEKIDAEPCLRIWEDSLIRNDGTPEKKGFKPFLPERLRKP
jgi:hypothetical protein